jgi:hypothetical protein
MDTKIRIPLTLIVLPACAVTHVSCGGTTPERGSDSSSSESASEASSAETMAPDATLEATAGQDAASAPDSSSEVETGSGPLAECGNAEIENGEECDDGVNDGAYGGCEPGCLDLAPYCGDGVVQREAGEGCDTAVDAGDTCNAFCRVRGSVIATLHEAIPLDGVSAPRGGRATLWNGTLTVAFGDFHLYVWELDREEIATVQLRGTQPPPSMNPLTGAHGLANGHLLVAGGAYAKVAAILDEDLEVVASYAPSDGPGQGGVVGVAPIAGGAVIGARDVNNINGSRYSAHWVAAISDDGTTLWESIDGHVGTDDYYARDLRALPDERSVYLTDTPSGPGFRIYDAFGNVEAEEEFPQFASSVARGLCVGTAGFFLVGLGEPVLIGFDLEGAPTFVTDYAAQGTPDNVAVGCAALADGSPLVAMNLYTSGEPNVLEVQAYDGPDQRWVTTIETEDLQSFDEPVVWLDEGQALAWVFAAGSSDPNTGVVFAAVVAL